MKPLFKLLSALSLIFGAFLLFSSQTGLTGAFIGTEKAGSIGNILGLVLIIVGIFIGTNGLENKVNGGRIEWSIQEAVSKGVPLHEAKKIYEISNKKVESGEWIELGLITVRGTTAYKLYPHVTSLCRYWGPKEYRSSSNNKLMNLYKDDMIGKTHELVRGSDKYKRGGGGRLSEGTISIPLKGSRVIERHWEIYQMYKNKKNKNNQESLLI